MAIIQLNGGEQPVVWWWADMRPLSIVRQLFFMQNYKKTKWFAEIIEIFSNNPTGRYIYFNCGIEERNDAEGAEFDAGHGWGGLSASRASFSVIP